MNKDDKRRHEILGLRFEEPQKDKQGYDIRPIENVTLQQLQTLKEEDFLDLEECQNDSPSVGAIIDFIEEHPNFKAHGYIVTPVRSDYRVGLEGVICSSPLTMQDIVDCTKTFRYADGLDVDEEGAWVWYD